ncbi:adenylate/guanylate cyclase domain-containing protein [Marinobacterium nitratireducens]|uniref:Adenylate/guanylate cyclase domain-containing protein n=1 Tax=Marinobacterium nitratireducens TaxID=518897 RepID=A0A917Z6K4_9GAMM|nr:adenylate/guanylate cyclase domain-containing protein [Marinobacterium nitratireducens]GGO76179.1 adenylate/guanylate cyclase domain-containing protein [Marinobacterium nitratireducens]
MRCANCGCGTSESATYCSQCGTLLLRSCPRCGHRVNEGAKFCEACGASLGDRASATEHPERAAPIDYTPRHLADRIRAEQAALQARGAVAGERKIITALFADMAGSTSLIEYLDPEEVRRLIDPVLELMMEAVHHYEGYVAKSLGDGILALFGAPIAHEDHAQRALFAALRMRDAMARYSASRGMAQARPLQIRVGIHSGEVVVRSIRTEDLRTDYDPVGQTIHLASRLEGLAKPGSIVLSETTHRLAEGYFECRSLGAIKVRGITEPVTIFQLEGVGAMRTRLQVAAHRGLVRFTGRRRELARLSKALARTREQRGQVVGVVGEPGVGKSRLFFEFKQLCERDCRVLETFSVSHGKAFAYLPLIELLKNYFTIGARDDKRQCREKVTAILQALDPELEASRRYLDPLLGLDESPSELSQMDPRLKRQHTFKAVKQLLMRESLEQPLVIIVEDLQWLDRETLAFLESLIEDVAGARILLLVNYRPEYRHRWEGYRHFHQIRLQPLGGDESSELLDTLLGKDASLAPIRPRIMEQTEGNPFFLEEVVRTLVEEQVLCGVRGQYRLNRRPAALHIPTNVQGVLSARIDRLPLAQKALLQTLAVIGKAFSWSLMRYLVDLEDDELRDLLSQLQNGEFLYERPAFPEVEYSFKHALTQEVAYGSLLKERRETLHARTAEAIETLFEGHLEDHCNELAHHYTQGRNLPKAVQFLHCAGRQAAQRSANEEAIGHLGRALELLEALPDTPERARTELALQLSLGPNLIAVRGHAASEVEQAYRRALALQRQMGSTADLSFILAGLRNHYLVRAEHETASELGRQLLRLAEQEKDRDFLLEAHCALGSVLFFLGRLQEAYAHLSEALKLYDARLHSQHATLYGLEPGVWSRYLLAMVLELMGDSRQAARMMSEATDMARQRGHLFSLAATLCFAAERHRLRREGEQAQACAEAAIDLARENNFAIWLLYGKVLSGWAMAERTAGREGIERIRDGLAAFHRTETRLFHSHFLTLEADALGKAGLIEEALTQLADAEQVLTRQQEPVFEAELFLLKAELLTRQTPLAQRRPDEVEYVEACLRRSIATARHQGARLLELRAALALSDCLKHQGRAEDAHRSLARICGLFPASADYTDLKAARARLAQMG